LKQGNGRASLTVIITNKYSQIVTQTKNFYVKLPKAGTTSEFGKTQRCENERKRCYAAKDEIIICKGIES